MMKFRKLDTSQIPEWWTDGTFAANAGGGLAEYDHEDRDENRDDGPEPYTYCDPEIYLKSLHQEATAQLEKIATAYKNKGSESVDVIFWVQGPDITAFKRSMASIQEHNLNCERPNDLGVITAETLAPFWSSNVVHSKENGPDLWKATQVPLEWFNCNFELTGPTYPTQEQCEDYHRAKGHPIRPPKKKSDGGSGHPSGSKGSTNRNDLPAQETATRGSGPAPPQPPNDQSKYKSPYTPSPHYAASDYPPDDEDPSSRDLSVGEVLQNGNVRLQIESYEVVSMVVPGETDEGHEIVACTRINFQDPNATHTYVIRTGARTYQVAYETAVGGPAAFKGVQQFRKEWDKLPLEQRDPTREILGISSLSELRAATQLQGREFQRRGWGVLWVALPEDMPQYPKKHPTTYVKIWWFIDDDPEDGKQDVERTRAYAVVSASTFSSYVGEKRAERLMARVLGGTSFKNRYDVYYKLRDIRRQQLVIVGHAGHRDARQWEPMGVTFSKQSESSRRYSKPKERQSKNHRSNDQEDEDAAMEGMENHLSGLSLMDQASLLSHRPFDVTKANYS